MTRREFCRKERETDRRRRERPEGTTLADMAENIPQEGAAFERSYKDETSFINHVPKTREEREALRDKDKLEKVRLEVRS